MKKLFALFLACTMALGLAACGGKEEETPTPSPEEAVASMTAPIDALARCMLENDMTYDPKDPEFFWTSLFYFVGGYGTEHELVEETEDYKLKVPRKAMQEHALVLFSDYDDLLELPETMVGNIDYDENWDAYLVSRGDIGLSEMKLSNAVPTETGYTLTAELWSVEESPELMGQWEVNLVKNTYADGIENPLYLFSISSMTPLGETGSDTNEPDEQGSTAPEETVTAVCNGLSDSHTVEVTMPDGSISAFQFDPASEAGETISALQEGDGFTFGYITDAATGANRIVSVK